MSQAEQQLLKEMERVQKNLQSIAVRCAQRFEEMDEAVDCTCRTREIGTDSAVLQLYREELKRLEQGLARYHEGRYGICDSCGKPIEFARLQAIPYATRYAECQRLTSSQDDDKSTEVKGVTAMTT
jgi:DnaK suppressor protein